MIDTHTINGMKLTPWLQKGESYECIQYILDSWTRRMVHGSTGFYAPSLVLGIS